MNPLWLKVIFMLVMFAITLIAGLIPIRILKLLRKNAALASTNSQHRSASLTLCLLTCFSGGVFLATCFLDLLPDVKATVVRRLLYGVRLGGDRAAVHPRGPPTVTSAIRRLRRICMFNHRQTTCTQVRPTVKRLMAAVLVFEGLAVGTFLYVTFFEVLMHERDNEHPNLLKLFVSIVGFALISAFRLMKHASHGEDEYGHHDGFHQLNMTTALISKG